MAELAEAQRPDALGITPWQLMGEPRLLHGFAYGFSYPSVFIAARMPAATVAERAELTAALESLFEGAEGLKTLDPFVDPAREKSDDPTREVAATAQWFAALASRLTRLADLPVIQPARMIRAGPAGCGIAAPALSRGLAPMGGLLKLMLQIFQRQGANADLEDLRPLARELLRRLRASNLPTSNTPRLVKAAVANGIAFQEIVGTNLVQYGLGRKSALLDSTFTHTTPNIGARLARQKHEAAAMLRRHRLPVPDHVIVSDEQQAAKAAQALGYPVVIKPADKDGGVAVQADLRTEQELLEAYSSARRISARVLVEKFVPGRDYRLTVFQDRCIWAVERLPAGVTGDGVSSVAELVAEANTNPNRGEGPHAPLKLLKIDEEALSLLSREGLSSDSVPEAGRFVRLRRASNVSSGGMPVAVFDKMHPDNARLAIRAARALKLDLAGIDLLIPDISISWKEGGAAICEVNGQPELGGTTAHHLYPQVLKGVLNGGDGHIPTVAIVGGDKAEALSATLATKLLDSRIVAGLHNRSGVSIGGVTIEKGRIPQISAGRMLASNQRVDALIFGATNGGVLFHGFPVPRIDVLILTGEAIEPAAGTGPAPQPFSTIASLQVLVRNSRTLLVLDDGSDGDGHLSLALARLGLRPEPIGADLMQDRVLRLLGVAQG